MGEAVGTPHEKLSFREASRVVPGLYGWLATVLAPVSQVGASSVARGFALASLAALFAAFGLLTTKPRLARQLGIHGFLFGCFGAWLFLGPQLRSDQLDPVRSGLGALGFLLHALAWGAPSRSREEPPADNLVPGSPLQPRVRSPRAASVVLGAGIALALLPPLAAFGVERPEAALLAHAVGLGSGLLLVAAATDVALRIGKPRVVAPWRQRTARAVWSLGGLALTAAIGLLWLALR
ncbi:MAG TPA: hypothetical protein VIW29_03370 [Polyangiaceae bacterium]